MFVFVPHMYNMYTLPQLQNDHKQSDHTGRDITCNMSLYYFYLGQPREIIVKREDWLFIIIAELYISFTATGTGVDYFDPLCPSAVLIAATHL